jgi:hypothetical protein
MPGSPPANGLLSWHRMSSPYRAEEIRALIEEADRVCQESERVTQDLERSMKRSLPWWPDPVRASEDRPGQDRSSD